MWIYISPTLLLIIKIVLGTTASGVFLIWFLRFLIELGRGGDNKDAGKFFIEEKGGKFKL